MSHRSTFRTSGGPRLLMRRYTGTMFRIVAALGLALLIGCGSRDDDSSGDPGGNADLSAADDGGGDLGLDGCRSFIACVADCVSSTSPGPARDTCLKACDHVTDEGFVLYQKLESCQNHLCNALPDGGGTRLCATDPPTPACNACYADSIKMTGTCADATYCGACYAQYIMCESSRP